MPQYRFSGKILPERIPLSVDLPEYDINILDNVQKKIHVCVKIQQSQIDIDASTDAEIEIFTFRNVIEGSVRSSIDLIGYLHGGRFDVDLITAQCLDTGHSWDFDITIPTLLARRATSPAEISGDLLKVVGAEPAAHLVLGFFREAMRTPLDTGLFCYRAIEAMMQSMKLSDSENENTVAWPRFRDNLNLTKTTVYKVKQHSDLPRHGKISSITDEERATIFNVTDEIIGRYLHFLLLEKKRLPLIDFPEF